MIRNKALPSIHDEQSSLLEAGDEHHTDHIVDIFLRESIDAALRDPRPPIPAESVLAQLEERHRARCKAGL